MNMKKLGFGTYDLVAIGFGLIASLLAFLLKGRFDDPRTFSSYLAMTLVYAGAIRLLARTGARPMVIHVFRAVAMFLALAYVVFTLVKRGGA